MEKQTNVTEESAWRVASRGLEKRVGSTKLPLTDWHFLRFFFLYFIFDDDAGRSVAWQMHKTRDLPRDMYTI